MTNLKYQFDSIASLYDEIRPKPPIESMTVVKDYAKLDKNSQVLEVGVGTGQATEELADLGCEITGLELGADLAKIAQNKFAANSNVNILNTSFEDWQPEPSSFDLFLCVQAFHWIDTAWGLNASAKNLKSGGSLAIMWHLELSSITDFYKATQPVYDRFNHLMIDQTIPQRKRPSPNNWETVKKAIEKHENFEELKVHRLNWKHHLDKEGYIKLLQTFSNQSLLQGQYKIDFYNAISTIIDDFGGSVTRIRETITLLATKS